MNGDCQLIKKRANLKIKLIFVVLAILACFMLVVCIVVSSNSDFRETVCSCKGRNQVISQLVNFYVRLAYFVIELSSFLYYTVSLAKRNVKFKYNIKTELIGVSVLWMAHRLMYTVILLWFGC